ncbi:hypothetical protein [Acidocella sp. KAb 2-4]|uniref:hypothetical protein n=1 Tax=Acidocella sp. KAb 2-4 TaxID=2885158 RepID=UPI001D0846E7|nr:hypothetical protein [Acidocella sp. KAb 2-4]MCB5944251.1 hypothetical protein [Acidocella sp. KAb 2-4]
MSSPTSDCRRLLKRKELAESLTEEGFPIKTSTLAVFACRGEGPPFTKWGSMVLYEWGDALEWARNRLSKKVHSTAELSKLSVNDNVTSSSDAI